MVCALGRQSEDKELFRATGERVPALLPVGKGSAKSSVEAGSVLPLSEVNEFMNHYEVHKAHRQLQDIADELADAALRAQTHQTLRDLERALQARALGQ